jgi:regulatory protein
VPKITRIKSQKSKKRVNVYLDDRFAFGLTVEALVGEGLRVGQELSEKEIKQLKNKNKEEKALARAFKFLSYRPRSEKELIDYLKKKGVGPGLINQSIKKLRQLKLLNDRDFTNWFVAQRISFRPKGKRALRAELRQKGIKPDVIEEALEKAIDEVVLARKAAQKKLKAYGKLSQQELRKKMTGFLYRRGFSWEVVKSVLEEIVKKR